MTGIHGTKQRPLGEIKQLPVTIGTVTIPIDTAVTASKGYDVILGNDWLKRLKHSWTGTERYSKSKILLRKR